MFERIFLPLLRNIMKHRRMKRALTSSTTVVSTPRTLEKVSSCGFPPARRSRFYPKRRQTCTGIAYSWLIQGFYPSSSLQSRDNPGNRVTRGWADPTMQILLRADSTTNGPGSIKTRITMPEHQAMRIRTSRCIIHALYTYNSYLRALTYRERRCQLHSIYRCEYRALRETVPCGSYPSNFE